MVACLLAAALLLSPTIGVSQTLTLDEIKAAFLFNFTKFVEWPVDPYVARPPLTIAVLGNDAIAAALSGIIRGKTVEGRVLASKRLTTASDLSGIQLLFVGAAADVELQRILRRVGGAPILTVSDGVAFAAHGGAIGLTTDRQRVRFEINLGAAERSGLRISSRLLTLASRVYPTTLTGGTP